MRRLALLFALYLSPIAAPAQQPSADATALSELEKFLFDAAARQSFAASNPQAKQANDFLTRFPPWAQQELLEIVMLIMRESRERASLHGEAFAKGGAAGAMTSFSPLVRSRVQALAARLAADKSVDQGALRKAMP